MTLYQALNEVATLSGDQTSSLLASVASEFYRLFPKISIAQTKKTSYTPHQICVALTKQLSDQEKVALLPAGLPESYIYLKINESGIGCLIASQPYYLHGFVQYLLSDLLTEEIGSFINGRVFEPAFKTHRVAYDYFLTQEGRITQGLDRDTYMRELARNGFTHVEVNGLGSPMAIETGPKGEVYPMFYTYCPALDQFVYSSLNKGIYPYYYLSANLNYLKENAALARKYGLIPGLLSFEPRAVPEEFFKGAIMWNPA